MNFAIWSAVSTPGQAKDDKTSLAEQESQSRAVGEGKGWTETAGPFRVPGESRTRWVNLRDAESEIPALRAMLESAKRRDFDVLVLYDYNRMRDLVDQVAKTLAFYGAQMYSINQPVEPLPPEVFHPYANDSESMMRGMSQVFSRAQIADLRRKWQYGVPARVRKGMHSTRFPWGYTQVDSKSVPVPVPSQARIIVEVKEMFLQGIGIHKIVDHLNEHYPTPKGGTRWETAPVKYMLRNSYYAGLVTFGKTKTTRDPYRNTRQTKQNAKPAIEENGKHQALYSQEDYQAILLEFQRRRELPNNRAYAWSGLLICSVCGRKLNHVSPRDVWRCKYLRDGSTNKDHIGLPSSDANRIILDAVLKAIFDDDLASLPVPEVTRNSLDEQALIELQGQRQRIQEMCKAGIYSISEAEQEMKVIDSQIDALMDVEKRHQKRELEYRKWLEAMNEARARLNKRDLRALVKDEPREANEVFTRLFKEIQITPDHQVTTKYRFA